jgi:hypothetical protein
MPTCFSNAEIMTTARLAAGMTSRARTAVAVAGVV